MAKKNGSISWYDGFIDYYQKQFSSDIVQMVSSYPEDRECMRFLGFNQDHLINIDTVLLRQRLQDIKLPSEEDAAFFSMAVWTIIVSDLIVYDMFHDKARMWDSMTKYPKFTSWNYNATEPSYMLALFAEAYPERDVRAEIQHIIDEGGELIVCDLTDDIIGFLHLDQMNRERVAAFAKSWLTLSGNGIIYNDQCFLY